MYKIMIMNEVLLETNGFDVAKNYAEFASRVMVISTPENDIVPDVMITDKEGFVIAVLRTEREVVKNDR